MKAYIFDMDGTILDSTAFWKSFANNFLRHFGFNEDVPYEKYEKLTLHEAICMVREDYLPEKSMEELDAQVADFLYNKYRNEFELKDGVLDLFEYIRSKGGKIALATATETRFVKGFLERHKEVAKYFEFTESVKIGGLTKNQPEFFRDTVARFGEKPEKAFMFEDAPHAMESASKAGLTVVAVTEDTLPSLLHKVENFADYKYDSIATIDRSILGLN